jgi:hypothetical protein
MKRLLFYPIIACVFMINTASMCSSDDDSSSSSADVSQVVNTVSDGTWRVTLFDEDGNDHTNDFNGYNFTFGESNVLTATNGSTTITGYWSVTNSSSNDDSPSDVDFNILFTSPSDFAELSEDWHILERTPTKIRLRHISGGNGGTDLLTFEKN